MGGEADEVCSQILLGEVPSALKSIEIMNSL